MNIVVDTMLKTGAALAFVIGLAAVSDAASPIEVTMHEAKKDGSGDSLGTVLIEETPYGLVFTPRLKGLAAGLHGFHIHTNADCGPGPDATTGEVVAAGAAGGHLDPENTGRHSTPWDDDGHLGDLPALFVSTDGAANSGVLAPKLKKLADIRGRALMIHAGGDTYADEPKPLGGGGARVACGVIK